MKAGSNGWDRQRIANALEGARLQAVDSIEQRAIAREKQDLLEVLVVAQWYDGMKEGQTRGPVGLLKAQGPTLGLGTGIGAGLVAIIQALGNIFGK